VATGKRSLGVAYHTQGIEMANRYTYRRMTPAEIRKAFDALGVTIGQFSRVIGARYNGPMDSTVQKWLDGTQDAPTYLPALLALMSRPGGVELARAAAELYIEEE